MIHKQTQPALLISYNSESIAAIEPVQVPNDWDFDPETLPFTIGSNQIVTTEKITITTSPLTGLPVAQY
jgi:hypothetical protein